VSNSDDAETSGRGNTSSSAIIAIEDH